MIKAKISIDIGKFIHDIKLVIHHYWESFLFHLPRGLFAVIIIAISFFVAAKLSHFLSNKFQNRTKDPLLLEFIARIIRYVLIIAGLMIALQVIGFTGIAGGLLAGAGISAFIIGFAFKDIGENFLAGIILAFNRPFRIKDTIKVDDHIGKVTALHLRTTLIKTFDGKDIFIPNSIILKQPLTNFTRDGLNRHEFMVHIGIEQDVDEVSQVIIESIKTVEGIVKERPPYVTIEELKNNGIELKVYFWIYTYDYKKRTSVIKTEVIKTVKNALITAGIIKTPEKNKPQNQAPGTGEKAVSGKAGGPPADSYKITDNDKEKNK